MATGQAQKAKEQKPQGGEAAMQIALSTAVEEAMKRALTRAEPEVKAEIVEFGEKLILPEGMSISQAVALLERRRAYEEEEVVLMESFDVFPWDGAAALARVLERRYGFAPAKAREYEFFGQKIKEPPELISVHVGPDEVLQVPWGDFELPHIEGKVSTGAMKKEGRACFRVSAAVKRREEKKVQALFRELREEIATHSIYRGKAIKIRFRDEDGDLLQMPEPRFLDTASIRSEQLILSESVERQVHTNLFTPITRAPDCLANGIALKRGVLLAGTYGTGKTMIAHVASRLAADHGITYVYVQRADELPDAIHFAKQYQSPACVIFVEDIDRVLDGERDATMDEILNTIDGIDAKSANLIVVATTNAIEGIEPAMLRPGRLDAVIHVTPPDAKAVERLVRAYGGAAIDPHAELGAVGQALEGQIPAVIAEVVKRAKLAQLALQPPGTRVSKLTGQALLEAAESIRAQVQLLECASADEPPPEGLEEAFGRVVREASAPQAEEVHQAARGVRRMTRAFLRN